MIVDQRTPVAVVTGATGGIGRAVALELAATGCDVVLHAREQSGARATDLARKIQTLQRDATCVTADLADRSEQDTLVDRAWTWRDGVDVWVNVAGVDILTGETAGGSFEEKLDSLLAVDLAATMRLSRDVGRRMRERGRGVLVNIGWDGAARGMAGDSAQLFAAAKGGVEAFSRSLAQTLAPSVRVVCVAPGWIRTAWGENASDEWQSRAARESLMDRWGEPEDVARVVRFVASNEGSFLSGETINVNGGFRFPT